MSIFSSIGNFLKKLFGLMRPGIDKFLDKYRALAITEVKRLADVNTGIDFIHWEKQAWANIKALIQKDLKDAEIPGNWITMLLSIAFEIFKGELLKKK